MALAEDLGWGDLTTDILVPDAAQGRGIIVAKAEGVLAGGPIAARVFHKVDASLKVDLLLAEGSRLQPGQTIATVQGRVPSILKAERLALNFLQHLSGIATETARYVEAVAGLPTIIVDTRKTTPGLRLMEKYAVRMGGGRNHRYHLGDGILIKDNHLAALRRAGLSLAEAVNRAKTGAPHTLQIEVEVESLEQAREAVEAGAHIIMLDNMGLEEMRQAVEMARGRALVEASGGITLENVRAVAETGVDFISVGALTHSVKALDISLELEA
ncbi:MAG TPA: carboxylating nicotinate-nucleotide diphosphorylase [Dehalococcoidia bacterium]|nr:carboxylating nicotinate-nucleotide diphosphorylase [Dehalococcoidia bacterium]